MIDSSKSPVPLWKRYATAGLLTVLVLVMGYVVWAKELHHTTSSSSTPPAPAVAAPSPKTPATTVPTATTIPGGVPVSARDPFGS